MLVQGKVNSIEELARQASKHRGDVAPILRLAFLSPNITQAILESRQPFGTYARHASRDGHAIVVGQAGRASHLKSFANAKS
jgi:hypothetical protein